MIIKSDENLKKEMEHFEIISESNEKGCHCEEWSGCNAKPKQPRRFLVCLGGLGTGSAIIYLVTLMHRGLF
jgi:hypothetical protein